MRGTRAKREADWRKTRQARWKKRNPWARFVEWARRRCNAGPDSKWYPYYGAKGIRCTLTAAEAKLLWERDGAAAMKRPSLDRRDPDMGYQYGNCCFREWIDNVLRPHSDAAVAELAEEGAGFS